MRGQFPSIESLLALTRRQDGADLPAVQGWQGPQFGPPPQVEQGDGGALGSAVGLGASRVLGALWGRMNKAAPPITSARDSARAQGLGVMRGPAPEGFGGPLVSAPRVALEPEIEAPQFRRRSYFDFVRMPEGRRF